MTSSHRVTPRLEAVEGCNRAARKMSRDLGQATLHLEVRTREHEPTFVGQIDVDATAVSSDLITADEAAGDEPVDDTSDARAADGKLLSECRRGLSSITQGAENAVLRERQIEARDGQFDVASETRDHAARMG
jgi:hypothetical protein